MKKRWIYLVVFSGMAVLNSVSYSHPMVLLGAEKIGPCVVVDLGVFDEHTGIIIAYQWASRCPGDDDWRVHPGERNCLRLSKITKPLLLAFTETKCGDLLSHKKLALPKVRTIVDRE